MNLICDKQMLQDSLALVGRAVPTRSTMPILECVLLAADENGLTLSGNDKEICIDTAPVYAQVEEPGSIALDAKLFTEIVRKLSGDSIAIETDERNNAVCKSGRSRLKIAGQPADEFPVIHENEFQDIDVRYTIKANVLRDMIRQTIFAVAVDQTKLILTGELMEIKNNVLQIVALDMYRIAYRAEILGEDIPDAAAVIPGKALNELSRILPAGEEEVSFFFTKNRAVFETSGFRLVSSLLDGEYIRYERIFNEDFTTMVVAERAPLLAAFERAVLVATESRALPIKIDIQDDDMILTAQSERGHVEDGVPCQTEGKDLTISFNPRYFIEVLRVIEDERVVMKFNTAMSPCTIRGADSEINYKYLIVPLRPMA